MLFVFSTGCSRCSRGHCSSPIGLKIILKV
jgi:hypothetical protein